MSIIHDQAMHYIYQQVLERLLRHMSQAQRASLQLLIQRLLVAAGGPDYIGNFRLLVVQGSDRRSARLLAVLRAAQLSIALRAPVTFKLRVLVACLPATSSALLEQHERSFSALFMQDDPRVQLEVISAGTLVPFHRRPVLALEPWPQARDALLQFGHLVDARPEVLLGCRMHLELADAIRLALAGQPCIDALVTAMPWCQRRRFLAWARKLLRLGVETGPGPSHAGMGSLLAGLGQLHGVAGLLAHSAIEPEAQALMRVLALDDLLPQLLSEGELDLVMGWRFEPGQDCSALAAFLDPLALAQLHELQARCQAPLLPRAPLRLVSYQGEDRAQAAQQVRLGKAYGIGPVQLECLLYRPFVDRGQGLERFLRSRHADMLVALPYLHRALQGEPCPDAVKDWLVNTSGLALAQLRTLYAGRLDEGPRRLLASLARRDVELRLLPPPGEALG
ncbi:hypothetical protein F3J44_14305 [Pantoea sp. Tr-811]|uniref:hypothetical protein n=1 Tax=Pantoea sp. Tr-811 TaxID=2608361 RepID=UPI00141FA598|nr:hypothetical protein [Pantoea sp. Tr-811]NIF27538.1 hypothetical protein [Pantoea sp. Tr-811]